MDNRQYSASIPEQFRSLSLADFQQGVGVPAEQQLVLINNPSMFHGYSPLVYPWRSYNPLKYLKACAAHRALYRRSTSNIAYGLSSTNLFLGFYDRSYDRLDALPSIFEWIRTREKDSFNLVIGKGDYTFDESHLQNLPDNLENLWVNNLNHSNSRVHYLPMGRDFRSADLFGNMQPCADKTSLCYANFSINTHPIRPKVRDWLAPKPFVTSEHMGNFLQYNVTREDFFSRLSGARFSICPRGNGFDTFRMWDSLYVGTIPIVVDEAEFHSALKDLPILFLDNYEQIAELDESQLLAIYDEMMGTPYNYAKLFRSFWLSPNYG